MKFVKLTETNEHEGETWRFWLQVEGNEDQLAKLRSALGEVARDYADAEDCPFILAPLDEAKSEVYVNALVDEAEEDDDGYMAPHHKLTGVLTVPDWKPGSGDDDIHEAEQDLYKGQISKLFSQI